MACAVDAILEVVENLSCWFHECQMLKLPSFSSVRRCDELEWVVWLCSHGWSADCGLPALGRRGHTEQMAV